MANGKVSVSWTTSQRGECVKEGGQHLGLGYMALVEEAGLGVGRAMPSGIKPRGQVQRCSKGEVRATEEIPDQRLVHYRDSPLRWLRLSLQPALGRSVRGTKQGCEGSDAG